MPANFSNAELEAYLDESLPVERMAAVEDALRHDDALGQRLSAINGRRDAGVHSLGEIWRRRRLSCPTREQLGSYLLGVLAEDAADYVRFHLETVGCRCCAANVDDLQAQQSAAATDQVQRRRHRYFHSSAGYLHKQDR
jgi:anti-sigma factor RsiW